MKVAPACRLFGHCRQAYYQSKADIGSHVKNERLMLDTVREIRGEDPGIGGYKLWIMLTALFGERFMPGRDSFYTLLRRHRLMLRLMALSSTPVIVYSDRSPVYRGVLPSACPS